MTFERPIETLASTPFLEKLCRKDCIPKPNTFREHEDIKIHIKEVEDYCDFLKIEDSIGKVLILKETVEENVWLQIKFEPEFEDHKNDFDWVKRTLTNLFPCRTNATCELVELNKLKQNGKSLMDFCTTVKVNCAKKLNIFSNEYLQQVGKEIFINGIDDPNLRKALELQKPDSLHEAYELVRELKVEQSDIHCRKLEDDDTNSMGCDDDLEIRNLNMKSSNPKLLSLEKKVDSIILTLQKLENYIMSKSADTPNKYVQSGRRDAYRQHQKFKDEKRCFNCGSFKHLARNCFKNRKQFGERKNNFRLLQDVENNDNENNSIHFSDNCSIESLEHESNFECKTMNTESGKKRVRTFSNKKATKHYPQEILELENYVTGRSINKETVKLLKSYNRERATKAMTVITKTHPERAKNKPVVIGSIQTVESKIFIDSGSEINVIDRSFLLNDLKVKEECIKRTNSTVKCANSSQLKVLGKVTLKVQLGMNSQEVDFLVTDKLFPNVIIGIVAMKLLDIVMDVRRDGIYVNEFFIPFLSKVETTTYQKNGRALYLGIGMQQSS